MFYFTKEKNLKINEDNMRDLDKLNLGIYEKALPKDIDWIERIKLVKECGYDFVEISIDETDERLARLDWSDEKINRIHKALIDTGVRIPSMCFSGHRRFPMGSINPKTREKAMELMKKAIIFSDKMGIITNQMAVYDVYYDPDGQTGSEKTKKYRHCRKRSFYLFTSLLYSSLNIVNLT